MPDLAQGGFRFSIYQRPSPGQSDVNANLPGHHPQGCKTFQPGFINPSLNPGFSSLSFSTLEFMVEQSGVENRKNSVMKKSWVAKVRSISPKLNRSGNGEKSVMKFWVAKVLVCKSLGLQKSGQ